mgnify:CR=1 FL=1|tara:strand:+ start:48896 stop:49747 length:852 start_codon:yes stop_codon:yes gene_type:complete
MQKFNYFLFGLLLIGPSLSHASEIAGKLNKGEISIESFWLYEFQRDEYEVASSEEATETSTAVLSTYLEFAATDKLSFVTLIDYADENVKDLNTNTNTKSNGLQKVGAGVYYQNDYLADKFFVISAMLQPKLARRQDNRLLQDRTRLALEIYHEWIRPTGSWGLGLLLNPSLDSTELDNGEKVSGGDTVNALIYYEKDLTDGVTLGTRLQWVSQLDEKNEDTDTKLEFADRVILSLYYVEAVSKNWEIISFLNYHRGLEKDVNDSDIKLDDGKEIHFGMRYTL